MNEPTPVEGLDDDWLRREGARWRETRDRCPDPDVLAARHSELLDPAMREALSRHVSGCEACARLASDLDAVASDIAFESVEARVLARVRQGAGPARRWHWGLPAAAAVLLACVAGAVWWMRPPTSTRVFGGAEVRPPQEAEAGGAEAPPPQVAANWTIEAAPVRVPISSLGPSRSGGAPADAVTSLIEALVPYRDGRYDEAIPLLDEVARAHPDSGDAAFYLGVARVLANHPAEAIAPLERAATLANAGRRAEIEWYRATAEQRSGKTATARARLDALCAAPGEYRARACAAAQALR